MTLSPSDLDRIEELAKAAKGAPDRGPWAGDDVLLSQEDLALLDAEGFDEGLHDLILSLVAMARRAPGWIPVEERMPAESERVLIWVRGKKSYVRIAHWEEFDAPDDREWVLDRGGLMRLQPDFWMPLPEPPEAKQCHETPIVGRAALAPPVEGRVSFAIERIVTAEDVAAIPGRRRHMLASHLSEMTSLLSGSLEESKIGSRDYRIRISVEPECEP